MCRIVDSLCLFKALIETAELLSQIKENNNTRITLECSISRSPNLGLIVHWEPYSMVSRDMIWYKKNLKKAANFFSNFLPCVYLFRLQLLKLYLLILCCSGSEARTVPVVFSIYFPLQLSFPPHHEGGVMAERSSWSADWCLTLLPILDNKINLTPQHRWESLTWNSCPPIFIFIPLSLFFCRIVLELNFKDVVNMIFWLFLFFYRCGNTPVDKKHFTDFTPKNRLTLDQKYYPVCDWRTKVEFTDSWIDEKAPQM